MMKTFTVHLQSATQYERVENVVHFVGEDESGSFGILPERARMMTMLTFGLARFLAAGQDWEFLALPGALAYFVDGHLYISTRRYLRGKNYETITAELERGLLAEEEALHVIKESLHRLEEEMFKRLWKMKPTGEIFE